MKTNRLKQLNNQIEDMFKHNHLSKRANNNQNIPTSSFAQYEGCSLC